MFKKVYGSSPVVVSVLWNDIVTSPTTIFPCNRDISEKGFKKLLIALHFLWAYPKNAEILALAFGVSVRSVQGDNLWNSVQLIAALKSTKITWPRAEYENPNTQIFIVTIDGVDFRVWEAKHPTMPYDKAMGSHKYNKKAALKYEIAVDIFRSKIVWISGPHKGSKHDKTIYFEGLRDLIPQGKKAIADRVYGAQASPDDHAKISLPSTTDSSVLHNFKSRARSRHETWRAFRTSRQLHAREEAWQTSRQVHARE